MVGWGGVRRPKTEMGKWQTAQPKRDTSAGTIFSRKDEEGFARYVRTSIKPMPGKIKSSVIQFRLSQHLDARKGHHIPKTEQAPKEWRVQFCQHYLRYVRALLLPLPPHLGPISSIKLAVFFPYSFSPRLPSSFPLAYGWKKSGWMLDDNKERHKARIVWSFNVCFVSFCIGVCVSLSLSLYLQFPAF